MSSHTYSLSLWQWFHTSYWHVWRVVDGCAACLLASRCPQVTAWLAWTWPHGYRQETPDWAIRAVQRRAARAVAARLPREAGA